MQILLIDDHPLFRAGVAAALRSVADFTVCAETGDAGEARSLVAQHRPDVAVVDLMLQEEDGLQLVRELRRDFAGLRIVVLSMLDEAAYAPKALRAGADIFLSKRQGPEAIVGAVRQVMSRATSAAATPLVPASEVATLSERELQVFRELGLGRSTQEIAAAFGVSVKTVESHRESIKLKLALPHANALVARAANWVRRQGLAR
ncbi:MAG: response regulator transcription factor [Candidatus Didemnitutus sp.]|nr:response regulator transcription factor [Candidatus Didemnitutus sp.]